MCNTRVYFYMCMQGYREITLLGQNIDAWGRDMEPKQVYVITYEIDLNESIYYMLLFYIVSLFMTSYT
jgi:tRNA A37 methylthiotransferase MiaB